VKETKEKERIVEITNEPIEHVIKVEHFIDFDDSLSKSKNKIKDKA